MVKEEVKKQSAQLDGCYVIKTDLSAEVARAETIHARYKDLARSRVHFAPLRMAFWRLGWLLFERRQAREAMCLW